MSDHKQTPSRSTKAIGLAIGAVVTTSLLAAPASFATENPFGMKSLTKGYMVADAEGKCGEGKCGANKPAAAQDTKDQKATEAHCGADKAGTEAHCGADKKAPAAEDAS